MRAWLLGVVLVGVFCLGGGFAAAQAVRPSMSLILIDEAGVRSAPIAALGGTVVVGRGEAGRVAGPDQAAPDRADLAFEPGVLADKGFLQWVAGSGPKAVAVLTVGGERGATVYRLSGLVSRVLTATQSADGAGQVSLVLAAAHAEVGGVALN